MIHFFSINKICTLGSIVFIVSFNNCIFLYDLALSLPEPALDPLEIPLTDPLIPHIVRPLTILEQTRLRKNLNKLNQKAQKELNIGNVDLAFSVWYRELRLGRVLGRIEEINRLGEIGKVAWELARKEDVQIISKRISTLHEISEKESSISLNLLMVLADAYFQLNNLDNSIIIYKKILKYAQKKQITLVAEKSLQGLGKLYLAKFDFPNAARIYEKLLYRAQIKKNIHLEEFYLQILSSIYNASSQTNNSVQIKEKLVKSYFLTQKIHFIPSLKVDIGQDYQLLDQPEIASKNYQEAYTLAWKLKLFRVAEEALIKLSSLYESYKQVDYALQIYQKLLQVEKISYNYYGLMKTYSIVGEIYMEKFQYELALSAFTEGLILARSLNHNQEYFLMQIKKVNKAISKEF
ncbi:MAG: Tetratricopeptide repeat [Candidatus Atelocyanobacterium thalassa isolate SIO64986]|uniref:Tetratricopeptide repeat n=1 Tax=Candidatus Atelocyanobacterium thalassa isolate SIO64986 TaxID=1527444 RepID=A0A086CHB9_9CHRO|nr:MAG: Tetratricopeptide repeat [Candidatus Atelocyanobacterium thalassa isolate SIO64986]